MWRKYLTYLMPSFAALALIYVFKNEHLNRVLLVVNSVICTTAVGSLFMFSANISSRTNWIRPYSSFFTQHAKVLPNCGLIYLLLIAETPTETTEGILALLMHSPIAIAVRLVLLLGLIIWIYFKYLHHERFYFPKRLQALLMVVAFIFLNMMPFDLLIPSTNKFSSTLASWYILAASIAAGTALSTFEIMQNYRHKTDKSTRIILGTFLLALSCFRGYLAYSQDFLIWYANLPDEVYFYLFRAKINLLFYLSIILNYIIPFIFLFSRKWKKRSRNLRFVSLSILLGYMLDLYTLVQPELLPSTVLSFGCYMLISALMLWTFIVSLSQKLTNPIPITTLILLIIITPGCNISPESTGLYYTPDMHYTTAITHYKKRQSKPVKGTFSRNRMGTPLSKTKADRTLSATLYLMPAQTDSTLRVGKQRYSEFCMQCHGEDGDGKGYLVRQGKYIYPPRNFGNEVAKNLSDGEIFHAITVGYNLMGAHGTMLSSSERWAVVGYVRELQKGTSDN